MPKSHVPSAPVALGLAILLLAPFEVAAKSGGAGLGAHHGGFHPHHQRPFRSLRHDGFRDWTPYGGYVTTAPYYGADYFGEAPLQTFVAPPEPLRSLDCKRSQATVTVPSEEGGTRQIVVTRC